MAEEVEVSFNPSFAAKPVTRNVSGQKLCAKCGDVLDDNRKTYHDQCKPEQTAPATRLRGKGKKGSKPTEAVTRGMNSITGKLLYLVTLFIAWSVLRGMGVPDQNGDIADQCAMSEDEAEAVGRPLTRLFLNTDRGRTLAPKMVDNEDLIDAAFAMWDWYRRMNEVTDQLRREMTPAATVDRPPPVRMSERRTRSNVTNGQTAEDRTAGETVTGDDGIAVGYVPPSPIDLLGA